MMSLQGHLILFPKRIHRIESVKPSQCGVMAFKWPFTEDDPLDCFPREFEHNGWDYFRKDISNRIALYKRCRNPLTGNDPDTLGFVVVRIIVGIENQDYPARDRIRPISKDSRSKNKSYIQVFECEFIKDAQTKFLSLSETD